MRRIYSLFITLFSPFLILRLWYKSIKNDQYRKRIPERFSLSAPLHPPIDVWLHVVSLGEAIAAKPLINALIEQKSSLLITCMTPTGSEFIQKTWGENVTHQYVPYDIPWCIKRFLKNYKPKTALIMETEIWPNLVYYTHAAQIPLFLINGRISPDTFDSYEKIKFLLKSIFNCYTAVLAQSVQDLERFKALGVPSEKLHLQGNIKFDIELKSHATNPVAHLKTLWGEHRPVLIFASTHHNEEEKLLNEYTKLKAAVPDLVLLIAPRHQDRFKTVYELCHQYSKKIGLRSNIDSIQKDNEIIVLDSLGELTYFYALSNVAYVGGSLVPIGGHNVLEAIAYHTPVVVGPHMHNFEAICETLLESQAIKQGQNESEVIAEVIKLLTDSTLKQNMAKLAYKVLEDNQGALQKTLMYAQLSSQG